jgi:hypothetical protein
LEELMLGNVHDDIQVTWRRTTFTQLTFAL